MTMNIFVCNNTTNRMLTKKTKSFFHQINTNNTIFSFKNHDFVISIFDKRIRISIVKTENFNRDIQILNDYLLYITDNTDVMISTDKKDYLINNQKINIKEMWEDAYDDIKR